MSLTPNANYESRNTVRSAVHTSGGISKTLLTPCRRIGLSRRTPKTKSSLLNYSPASPVTPDNSQKLDNVDLSSTPKLQEKVKKIAQNKCEKTSNIDLNREKYIIKGREGVSDLSSNIVQNNRMLVFNLGEKIKISEENQNNDKKNKSLVEIQKDYKEIKTKQKCENDEKAKLKKVNRRKENRNSKPRKKKRKLCSSSDEDDEYTKPLKSINKEYLGINPCKTDGNQGNSDVLLINSEKTKVGSIKKCLSLKKSMSFDKSSSAESEDEITFKKKKTSKFAFPSQESMEEQKTETISDFNKLIGEESSVTELEKRIAGKKQYLEELKRAEVYKKAQNVDELKNLTNLWKKGCESALRDLLKQLQQHCQINMETLLNNLKVPKDKINYDPLNDVFL